MGARLEPHLSKPGRVILSLFEASTSSPFLLAASDKEEVASLSKSPIKEPHKNAL